MDKSIDDLISDGYFNKIYSFPEAINFTPEQRLLLSNSISSIKSLSKEDKINFDLQMKSVKDETVVWDQLQDKSKSMPTGIFPGGWHNKPLKAYAKKLGYDICHCGNAFDLWLSAKTS